MNTAALRALFHPHLPEPTPAKDHDAKVRGVVAQLRAHAPGTPLSLGKGVVSHKVPKPRDKWYADRKINLSELNEILEIDAKSLTCTAEPGVTFDHLVHATLKHGLLPVVVPELRTITVGGAVSGCALESMSFRYGGFHDSCISYDVITGHGEILHCTPDNEHKLIFAMMHGSFGTLGVLSKLTFQLVPAKRFVRVRYESYRTLESYKAAIRERHSAQDVDFMDGIIHAPDVHVLSLGSFVDSAPYTNRYDWMKVYYRSTRNRAEDYMKVEDYLFRYDNGVTNVYPKSALGRLLLGKLLHSNELLRLAEKLHTWLPREHPDVTLDTFVPISRVDAYMEWYTKEVGFFPVWCVPYHMPHKYEWIASGHARGMTDELFLDLAVYGMKQPHDRNIYKEIEGALRRLNGVKTLISYNYYEPDEFWAIWNRPNYLAVKKRVDPENLFRDLYSKTCRAPHGLDDVPLPELS